MSCRRLLLAVTLAMIVTTPGAQAAWLIGADAGVGIPTGTFGDLWSSGFSGGISASYLVNPRFAAGIDLSYSKFGTTSDYPNLLDFIDPGASDDLTSRQYGVHGDYKIPVNGGSKFSPYVVAGLGLYSLKDKYESPTNSDELTQTAFGIRGGLGCDYWISPTFGA